MPADLLANADGLVSAVVGFWRFVASASYRTKVRARWQSRTGAARVETVLEIAGAVFFGVVLPVLVADVLWRARGQ